MQAAGSGSGRCPSDLIPLRFSPEPLLSLNTIKLILHIHTPMVSRMCSKSQSTSSGRCRSEMGVQVSGTLEVPQTEIVLRAKKWDPPVAKNRGFESSKLCYFPV